MNNIRAGLLEELGGGKYRFSYQPDYAGAPVSLTMPIKNLIPITFEKGVLMQGRSRKKIKKAKWDIYQS